MSVKEHYDIHLGNFYSWMVGDFKTAQEQQEQFFREHGLTPSLSGEAIDLGAGHGVQAVSLAKIGFRVKAIDFNEQLLEELSANTAGMDVAVAKDDILNVRSYETLRPELIACCGDTILHLPSRRDLERLVADIAAMLVPGGKVVLSFRDYSNSLDGDSRFFKVKADETRVLTCCLDYEAERVRITDLLYYRDDNGWQMKVNSYYKIRVLPPEVVECVKRNGMNIIFNEPVNRIHTVIAVKPK